MSEEGGGNTDANKGESINLKVKSVDGEEVVFKVKKTTPFKKLMDAYCKRTGKDSESVRFMFDGSRLETNQTPADLDMEDGDEIDAMVTQVCKCMHCRCMYCSFVYMHCYTLPKCVPALRTFPFIDTIMRARLSSFLLFSFKLSLPDPFLLRPGDSACKSTKMKKDRTLVHANAPSSVFLPIVCTRKRLFFQT